MPDKLIDFHVNLLPPWLRSATAEELGDETENLKNNFNIAKTRALHRTSDVHDLLAEMERAGAGRAVVFCYQLQNAERCRQANRYVIDQVAKYPDRFLGLAVCQPRSPHCLDGLQADLAHAGMIGVKMKPRWGGFSLSDTRLLGPICEMLIARNLILLTHITQSFHQPTGDQIADLMVLLRNFPRLKVVAAHMGAFVDIYDCHPPIRSLMENLWIDTSLPNSLAWLPALMRNGRRERYLFASDYPYSSMAELADRTLQSGLTSQEADAVLAGNARCLLQSIGITL
jgi:predicted TIM-barrel fold metal-dependent hydrolase